MMSQAFNQGPIVAGTISLLDHLYRSNGFWRRLETD